MAKLILFFLLAGAAAVTGTYEEPAMVVTTPDPALSIPMASATEMACLAKYDNLTANFETVFCNAIHDGFLCWPPTHAGKLIEQHCPRVHLSDPTKKCYRRCDDEGHWMGKGAPSNVSFYPYGWTNYTACFPAEVQNLLVKVYDDEKKAPVLFEIARSTRYLEIFGYTVSFASLGLSSYIFIFFKSLNNDRILIHRCLFLSMMMQVSIKLLLYGDQDLQLYIHQESASVFFCPLMYAISEYTVSATIAWMFIEGAYLNSLIHGNTLRQRRCHPCVIFGGWAIPLLSIGFWAYFTNRYYIVQTHPTCWYGYNFLSFFWILQGPRLTCLTTNFAYLVNIMRILVQQLRRTETSDIIRLRKTIRAALVLIPLLGVTNIFNMIQPPMTKVWVFAIWSYGTHFFRSFEGFFISLTYCFLNDEVQQVVRKYWNDYKARRDSAQYRRRMEQHVAFSVEEDDNRPRSYGEEMELQEFPVDNMPEICQMEEPQVESKVTIVQIEHHHLNPIIEESEGSSSNGNSLDMDKMHKDCHICDEIEKELEEAEKDDVALEMCEMSIKKKSRRRRKRSKRQIAQDLHWLQIELRNSFKLVEDLAAEDADSEMVPSPVPAGPSGVRKTNQIIFKFPPQSVDEDEYFSDDDVFLP